MGLQRNPSTLRKRAKIKLSLCPSVTENRVSRENSSLWLTSKEQEVSILQNILQGRKLLEKTGVSANIGKHNNQYSLQNIIWLQKGQL